MQKEFLDALAKQEGIEQIISKNPVTFVNGDNMAFLRRAKEEMMYKYWHVGIVDPPYAIEVGKMNLGASKGDKPKDYLKGSWDSEVPTKEYWDLLNYCCRNIIAWGGNYFTKEFDWSGRCFIVWDKMHGYKVFAHAELALTTFDKNAVIIPYSRGRLTEEDEKRRHPTMKPVYLYDYIHLNFVEKGQRILDTHGGSFTHAIAAYKNNLDLTIIEREKSYFDSGLEAFGNASVKGRLLF